MQVVRTCVHAGYATANIINKPGLGDFCKVGPIAAAVDDSGCFAKNL